MTTIDQFIQKTQTISDLEAVSALLGWDQETYMPDGSGDGRAEQQSTVAALVHQMVTDNGLGELMQQAESESEGLEEWQRGALNVFRRTRKQAVCLPEEFVRRNSRATSLGQQAWRQARLEADFSKFRDAL